MPVNVNRKVIFDAVKQLRGGKPYVQAEVNILDKAIDQAISEVSVSPTEAPQAPQTSARFQLGDHSLNELKPVKAELARCVKRAIELTVVDFRVQEGERTLAEQRAAVAAGNSRTMHSKHLRQADGTVWAVDLVAIIDGKVSWDFPYYAAIARAMDSAATELGVADHIRWGCAWDRVLSDFGGDAKAYMAEAKAYAARHAGSDLLDGPHFEWVP